MARVQISDVLLDRLAQGANQLFKVGRTIPAGTGLTVTIREAADPIDSLLGANATHYSAATGGSSSTSAFTADSSTGAWSKWLDPGRYDVTYSGTGITTSTRRIEAVDADAVLLVESAHAFAALSASNTGAENNAVLQAASDALPSGGTIFLPRGTFDKTGTWDLSTLGQHRIAIVGAGRATTKITQTDANVAIKVLSSVASPPDAEGGMRVADLQFTCKSFIQLGNGRGSYLTGSPALENIKLERLRLFGAYNTNTAAYGDLTDPDVGSDIVPALEELAAFGVGIQTVNTHDLVISQCEIRDFGIGFYGEATDNWSIDQQSRLYLCARAVHTRKDLGGNVGHVINSQLMACYRRGWIYVCGGNCVIENNFWESGAIYQDCNEFIRSDGDSGTFITKNRFNSTPGDEPTPMLYFEPRDNLIVTENDVGDANAGTVVTQTNAAVLYPLLAIFEGNTPEFPLPTGVTGRAVQIGPHNPYKFNYQSPYPRSTFSGVAQSVVPYWIESPQTGREVFQTSDGPLILGFKQQSRTHRRFIVRFQVRKVSGTPGVVIKWIGGATTTIINESLGLVGTSEVELVEKRILAPVTELGENNEIRIEIDNEIAEIEEIELVPVVEPIACRVKHSAHQSIANNTYAKLAFDTEVRDDGGFHDNATNNSRLTAPVDGWYDIGAGCAFASNATGTRLMWLEVGGATAISKDSDDARTTDQTRLETTTRWYLTKGQYVEAGVFQNSGGALDVYLVGDESPWFSMAKLGD